MRRTAGAGSTGVDAGASAQHHLGSMKLHEVLARSPTCGAGPAEAEVEARLARGGPSEIVEEHRSVDGGTAERDQLAGKPVPDEFLAAARALGVAPADAVVFEGGLAGVEAGRAGGFGFVVGVDRSGRAGRARELSAHGADVAVADLAELLDAS